MDTVLPKKSDISTFACPSRSIGSKSSSSDGLSGMSDEDKLGFTYQMLDHYVLTGECPDEEKKARIDRLHRLNLHKLRLMPKYVPGEDERG